MAEQTIDYNISNNIRPEMLNQSMLIVGLETVAKVSAAVTRITDLDVLLQTVVDLTKSSFELYHAHIYLFDEARQALVLAAGADEAGRVMKTRGHQIALDLVHSLVARCARSGQAIIIADVRSEPDFLPNVLLPETRSEMAIPLIINQEVIGVLDVQSQFVGRFDPADMRIKTILADQIAVAVENARSFKRVQQVALELQLRDRAIDSSTSGFLIMDMLQPNAPLIYVNAAFERTTGYSAAEALGRNPSFLQGTDIDQPDLEILGGALATGQECVVTLRSYRKDGTLLWVQLKMSPVYSENNNHRQLTHYVGIADDVTVRRQTEQQTQLMYEVSARLSAGRNSTDILDAISLYARSTGAVRSLLFYNDQDSSGRLWAELAAIWVDPTVLQATRRVQLPIGTRLDVAQLGIGQLAMRYDESALLINNVQTDSRLGAAEQQSLSAIGMIGVAILPFKSLGRWLGFAIFEWPTEYAFTEYDGRSYEVIIRQAASSVDATRAYQQAQEQIVRAARLTKINNALAQANTEEQILSACALIFDADSTVILNLAYVTCDATGQPIETHALANWRSGTVTSSNLKSPMPDTLFGRMIFADPEQVLFIEDIMTEPRADEYTKSVSSVQGHYRGMILIPLYATGQWQGLLTIMWPEPHIFTALETEVFTALRQTVSSVITTRRAYLNEEAAREEANLLYEISSLMNVAENEQQLVEAVMRYAVPVEANRATIMLWENRDFDTATVGITMGNVSREGLSFPLGGTIKLQNFPFASIVQRMTINFCADVFNDPRIDQLTATSLAERGVRSFVFAPLTMGDRWLGVLSIFSKITRLPADREIRMLRALSSQMTTVVERLASQRQTAQRAAELETVARVSAATASLLDVDQLLISVVELTKESFKLYHAHIYLLDETGEWLNLTAGAGEAGRIMSENAHQIALNHLGSLVARAGRGQQGVTVNDVTSAPDFLPNRLLPDTRSELAVPMLIGDKLIGVLDVQSETEGRFKAEDVQIMTVLADQIAVAVQNARLYQNEVKAAEQLREIDRLKSEFLASMSHELRTPLNSIIGFAEVLVDGIDGELPPEAVEDVQAIHDSGHHLLGLINDVLDLAKIEAGHMELDREDVDLSDVLAEVSRVTTVLIKDKPVHLAFNVPPGLPHLDADHGRLRQILNNLISNAIKFTDAGQIVVTAQLNDDQQMVQISVKDSGIGIAPEYQKVVFQQFRQVDSGSTRKVGGTGLGLPITQRLVKMHGGDIWLQSAIGSGSTFFFTIPVLPQPVIR